ncbi:hypothetical protein [Calothrix sp. CCY 0018]|uniref:hypothetical protein n=1 Tax=Calothrix sp. CCY 0018 TaxID=3103864 RepID=UPI0039C7482C
MFPTPGMEARRRNPSRFEQITFRYIVGFISADLLIPYCLFPTAISYGRYILFP